LVERKKIKKELFLMGFSGVYFIAIYIYTSRGHCSSAEILCTICRASAGRELGVVVLSTLGLGTRYGISANPVQSCHGRNFKETRISDTWTHGRTILHICMNIL
jgi:hypothetical protein